MLHTFSFGGNDQIDLSKQSVCLDPVYDVLWRWVVHFSQNLMYIFTCISIGLLILKTKVKNIQRWNQWRLFWTYHLVSIRLMIIIIHLFIELIYNSFLQYKKYVLMLMVFNTTIFQLFCGSQFHCSWKLEYQRKWQICKSHIKLYREHLVMGKITTIVVIGTN